MMRTLLLIIFSLGLVACVKAPASPWKVSLQFERSIPILAGAATLAVRKESVDPPQVLLNVQCEGENRTLSLPEQAKSPEICGFVFQFTGYNLMNNEPRSADFMITWGDDLQEGTPAQEQAAPAQEQAEPAQEQAAPAQEEGSDS